ncbi:major facilitator superfamily domain-containing protein [Mycena leptocephala]|nr:major facilitator superfamily domain-containing protein [Mycena leptocephala]
MSRSPRVSVQLSHLTPMSLPTEASGDGVAKDDDSIYDRIPPHRKVIITCVLAVCGFLAPVSSTTVLSAIPEVAATFNTTGSIINLTNAIYLVFMGISPCFWAPLSQVYGRRWICFASAFLFFASRISRVFVFRALTAFQGTSFLITERATAMGWFLSGTSLDRPWGIPFIAGLARHFYLQAALGGLATALTIHQKRTKDAKDRRLWEWTNPLRVIKLYRYPNLAAGSSALVWNMYSLLTPIRYIINPRFSLTTPIQSGLFYLAPGFGYIAGTFFGGRWADHTDRLRSCIPFMGAIIPGCMLIYGWSIEKRAGGVALPVIVMFLQGFAQLFCFPSLNTYCLDVMQSRSAEVVAGNYMIRYFFAAADWGRLVSTISSVFLVVVTVGIYCTVLWGESWRDKIDGRDPLANEKVPDPNTEQPAAHSHDEKQPA